MEIKLDQKPQQPIIIEGFPGFGLIGTIATEFLIEVLHAEPIGRANIKEMPAMAAIHQSKLVQPMGIFYSKKHNIVILHVVTPVQGIEWDVAQAMVRLGKELKAKELMSLEGVASPVETETANCFYYTNDQKKGEAFKKLQVQPLKEGIILGVTGALMLEATKQVPLSCIFVETHSALPDSKAAAKIIEVLNSYLKLDIDTKPLMQQAEQFEEKLKTILEQGKKVKEQQDKKRLSYVG